MLIRTGIRCWTRPCLGSGIFAYTLLGRALPGLLDFCVYCIRCKTETCSSSWIFAYTLQNRRLLEFLDFCVYATEQKPARVPGFCVYAAGQKPAWIPGFCVYATEQKPARVPGFLRIQLGRALPELLDFRVYAAEHRLADDSNKLQASV